MPNQVLSSVENNFTKGLITESTGLNFPENAATNADNCEFTLIGDVKRRQGITYEANNSFLPVDRTGSAMNTYKWNNVGGDGVTQIVVLQVGFSLYFYRADIATLTSPLSTQILLATIRVDSFAVTQPTFDPTAECQFTDGNGYLFVYHPSCTPFYCVFNANAISVFPIVVKIRDFTGVKDNIPFDFRPYTLIDEHKYNLVNQGWVSGNPWAAVAVAGSNTINPGSQSFTVAAGIVGVTNGQTVSIIFTPGGGSGAGAGGLVMSGTVTSYSGTTLVINVTSVNPIFAGTTPTGSYTIIPSGTGYINSWQTAVGNYPSNSDVWWYFKNSSGVFDPATTVNNVTLAAGKAPRGHFILEAFNQNRNIVSGLPALTVVSTTVRPKTGTWFQGRVWFTGVNAQQPAIGDADSYSWTENIYFSQTVQTPDDFGNCYQVNDPTSETLFGLLPTDGGVIRIQGCGGIYKLFPLQNALLIFAANGVWYLTGSQGIGFSANDYTIVKLSSVQSISSTSFVDVQGLPMFWNEEGIYKVEPAKQGTQLLNSPLHVNPLEVTPITVGTILDFYNSIPPSSKRYVRGAYHPIDYVVQWVYRDTESIDVRGRYTYNKILNYNTVNNAFFPYTLGTTNTTNSINGIIYLSSPTGSPAFSTPSPTLKYVASAGSIISFAEERDTTYKDWVINDYTSTFTTGYKLHGQGQRRIQIPFIYMYLRNNAPSSYKIQSIWDYAISGNSGRWSTLQQINNFNPNFGVIIRRHKLRGQGLVLQIKVSSSSGMPFDIMGWSIYETQNTSV